MSFDCYSKSLRLLFFCQLKVQTINRYYKNGTSIVRTATGHEATKEYSSILNDTYGDSNLKLFFIFLQSQINKIIE